MLNIYATAESLFAIQKQENKFLLFPKEIRQQKEEENIPVREFLMDYEQVLMDSKVDKPRLVLFARQLQLTFIMTRTLIRVLPSSLLSRFSLKIKQLFSNIHQNFLLTIDIILKEFSMNENSLEVREPFKSECNSPLYILNSRR